MGEAKQNGTDSDAVPLMEHLTALRAMLIRCFAALTLAYPVGYLLSPYAIGLLVGWSLPPEIGRLHYFTPMEVFWCRLKIGFLLAFVLTLPWTVFQCWRFLLPALYRTERLALRCWIGVSVILFLAGAAFCIGLILPMLMRFSAGFATEGLVPVLGFSAFLELAGWLTFAFGVMFQAPVAVLIAVQFGLVSAASLRRLRPYILVGILTVSALLTPPDVLSQILLTLPTWILFEIGLFCAGRIEKKRLSGSD